MVMRCTAASDPGPRNWISPMWLTSNKPTAGAHRHVLRDQAAAGHGYSTGISQPPKSTILAFNARCVAFSAVFLSADATAAAGVLIVCTSLRTLLYPANCRSPPEARSNRRDLAGFGIITIARPTQDHFMNPFRGILMVVAAAFAVWRGWQIHRAETHGWRTASLSRPCPSLPGVSFSPTVVVPDRA